MECPNCAGERLLMSERNGVEIDYCPKCRGVWLDRGELDKLLEKAAELATAEAPPRMPAPAAAPVPQPQPRYEEPRYEERRYEERRYEQPRYAERKPYKDHDDDYYKRKKKKSMLSELFDF